MKLHCPVKGFSHHPDSILKILKKAAQLKLTPELSIIGATLLRLEIYESFSENL